MKAQITNNPTYWKRIEYTTPGTYTFTASRSTTCKVIIVGGGGGGATHQGGSRTGGQGALIKGTTTITEGTSYTITVGAGGTYSYSTNINVGAQGGTGGSSTAFGNTCNGGTGGHAHTGWWAVSYYDGSPGSGTVVDGFTLTIGSATTASIYGTYGGGGQTTDGQNGYVMIEYISDASDYTYTVDNLTAKIYEKDDVWKAFK
jgi:hypothetical protein